MYNTKQLKLTKNIYKNLPDANNLKSNLNFSLFIKLKRFHFFILKYKQLLQLYYNDLKKKKAKKLHKNSFIKKIDYI